MTIYPTPSPEGIAKLQEFYQREHAMDISDEQAYEILGGLMRFLYLTEIKPLTAEEKGDMLASDSPTPRANEESNH